MFLGKARYSYIHWGQAVYPLWWPSLTKDRQTRTLENPVAVVKQTQSAWFLMVHTNELVFWFKFTWILESGLVSVSNQRVCNGTVELAQTDGTKKR